MDPKGTVWEVIQRLIMDEGAGDFHWHTPPRTTLTSPEVIADIDCPPQQLEGRAILMRQADLPLWYYHLLMEPWMYSWFVIGGNTLSEFNKFLRSRGVEPLVEEP